MKQYRLLLDRNAARSTQLKLLLISTKTHIEHVGWAYCSSSIEKMQGRNAGLSVGVWFLWVALTCGPSWAEIGPEVVARRQHAQSPLSKTPPP